MRSSGGLAVGFGAIGAALLSSLALVSSPIIAIVASPIAFAWMDWGVATALRVPGPSFLLRMFGRVVAAAAAGIALRVILSLAGTPRAPVLAPWILPGLAILLALSWSFAAIAGNLAFATPGEPAGASGSGRKARPPLADGALVMLGDFVAATFAVMLSIVAHEAPRRVTILASFALCVTMCARSLLVSTIAARLATRPSSPRRAVLAFVLWLAHSAIVTTLARDPIAWSGLGAAVFLTVVAVASEARRATPSPQVALGRATIAWSISTTLSLLLVIARA